MEAFEGWVEQMLEEKLKRHLKAVEELDAKLREESGQRARWDDDGGGQN